MTQIEADCRCGLGSDHIPGPTQIRSEYHVPSSRRSGTDPQVLNADRIIIAMFAPFAKSFAPLKPLTRSPFGGFENAGRNLPKRIG